MFTITMIDRANVHVETIAEALHEILKPGAMSIWDKDDNCILSKFNTK